MKKIFPNFRITLVICIVMLSLTSCLEIDTSKYYGDDIALAVASRESILGVYGNFQDTTIILEIDAQGRIFYGFLGTAIWYDEHIIAIGIVQDVTSMSVFYYDGYNVMSKGYTGSISDTLNENLIHAYFDIDAVNALKNENDWGKTLDSGKNFETIIKAEKPFPLSDIKLSKVYENLSADIGVYGCIFLNADNNGLMVYLMIGDSNGKSDYGKAFLVMFDKSGEVIPYTGIYELTASDKINYQRVLRDFKEHNGWKFY
ncbi:MAG: hypothetical protein WCI62_01610 [Erysipelotrichaceae bacterium]